MSDEKVLTKEIVEKLLDDEISDSLMGCTNLHPYPSLEEIPLGENGYDSENTRAGGNLSDFTSIDDDAAELLSNYDAGDLDLSGLTAISDHAAEYLSKIELLYGEVNLDGLKSIPEKAFVFLRQNDQLLTEEITVDGWPEDGSPPDEFPQTFEKFVIALSACWSEEPTPNDEEFWRGYLINPANEDSLGPKLSIKDAELLVKFGRGKKICLNGWYDVSELDVLSKLSYCKFKSLSLRFKEITADIAKKLVRLKAEEIALESDVVDEEAATVFKNFFPGGGGRSPGFCRWEGTKSISDSSTECADVQFMYDEDEDEDEDED
jgi:hypothetical protein